MTIVTYAPFLQPGYPLHMQWVELSERLKVAVASAEVAIAPLSLSPLAQQQRILVQAEAALSRKRAAEDELEQERQKARNYKPPPKKWLSVDLDRHLAALMAEDPNAARQAILPKQHLSSVAAMWSISTCRTAASSPASSARCRGTCSAGWW